MAQYVDDRLILDALDEMVSEKKPSKVLIQVREEVEANPVVYGKCEKARMNKWNVLTV